MAGRHLGGPHVPAVATVLLMVAAWCAHASGVRASATGALVLVAFVGIAGGAREWAAVQVPAGPCAGEMRVVADPRSRAGFASVIVEAGGHRVRASGNGAVAAAMSMLRAGEKVEIDGTCTAVAPEMRERELVAHVTGRMSVEAVGRLMSDGGGMWRAANRMRALVARGAGNLREDDRALFLGLVMGDDSAQSRSTVDDFRESGLSHLCSASGQNVAYLMAAAGPLLRRLSPAGRLAASLGVIVMFVFLTRGEPSVLRAAAMAAVAALNLHGGRPSNGRVVLATAVSVLLVVDPMLAFSVGFMLSVGATAGLAWLSHPLSQRLGVPAVVAATLAAQIGTLPVALAVFGRVPFVSVLTNPLAVPVAGAVMLVGLPSAGAAALLPAPVGEVVCAALAAPVRLVATVASVGAAVEPRGSGALVAWCVLLVVAVLRWRRCTPVGSPAHACGKVGHGRLGDHR
ncbi:MAG: ComEC/Rec2 family competence protein [Ilumatobacteraceae bacterium]